MTVPDFRQYQDPGVSVNAIPFPVIQAPLISPTVIALVGDSVKFQTFTETVQLNGTTPSSLTKLGISLASIVVQNKNTGVAYVASTPLGSNSPSGTNAFRELAQAGADLTLSTPDDTTTIQREGGSPIADGEFVTVTYNYTDTNYYQPTAYSDFASFRAQYGSPFDPSTGAVLSPLSVAALMAFNNGANTVVGAAVPTNDYAGFKSALDLLDANRSVNVVVPLVGTAPAGTPTSNVLDYLEQKLGVLEGQGILRRAFVGLTGQTAQQYQTAAVVFGVPRIALVGPTAVNYDTGATSSATRLQTLPAYYLAAAVAGSFASRDVQVPLTHKQIQGFDSIPNQEPKQNILAMQGAGVLVVYQKRDGSMIVKHGLTTQTVRSAPTNGSIYTQEISVQAARDRLNDLISNSLDNADLIGGVLDDSTPNNVLAVVDGALQFAVTNGLIKDYSGLAFNLPPTTPTVVEVRFQYLPTLPLNYVSVLFALNTQSGDLTFDDTTAATA